MSDTDNNDNALPPKLNLSRKMTKPAKLPPAPGAGAPAETPGTSRIKLAAKPTAKTIPKPLGTTVAKPLSKPKPVLTTSGTKPKTVLKAKAPIASDTVKLKAKPKTVLKAKAPIASGTVKLKAKPRPGNAPIATSAPAPVATPAKPTPLKPGGATLKAKPVTLKAKPVALKPKPAMGIKRGGVDTNAPVGSKRATSKIPLLNTTVPQMGSEINTKTIKIKPSEDVNRLTGNISTPVNPPIDAKIPDPKRQTSRISLEAALGTEEESTGPKTIRLKRPGKTPTLKVSEQLDSDGGLSKTSKIEMPKDDEAPATQKKTIKIKRPSQKRSAKKVSVKRETEAAENTTISPLQPLQPLANQKTPDTVHWTFIVSSIAATIVACVLIYVLCAQVFGPNISLTKLAYAAPDTVLPWPGRILK